MINFFFSVAADNVAASENIGRSKEAETFLVKGLEKMEPAFASFKGDMYAGLLPTSTSWGDAEREGEKGALFFWLFEPTSPAVDDSLVVWLNGGPGCSSFVGLLFENGPVTVPLMAAGSPFSADSPPLIPNQFSWTKSTRILYVEQPVGTGFSYGPEPQDETDVSRDFYYFLQNLYEVFPDLRPKELFIFGESYAGMYVPSMAHDIYKRNQRQSADHQINIAGIGVGNGVIDARVQGPVVIDYAWWHGMIDSTTRQALHAEWHSCMNGDGSPQAPPLHPFTIPDECGMMNAVLYASGKGARADGSLPGPNTYDVTTWDTYPVLFDLNSTLNRFFNIPEVRYATHAPDVTGIGSTEWAECIPGSGRRQRRLQLLDDDKPVSVVPYIAELLDEAGIRVLMYNGDRDLSCCAAGTEMLLDEMEWSGSSGWRATNPPETNRGLWMVKGEDDKEEMAGYAKSYRGLEFVVVYNSGHLVPYNQPRHALDLLTRFLRNERFSDIALPVWPHSKAELAAYGHANDDSVISAASGGGKETQTSSASASYLKVFGYVLVGFIAGIGSTLYFVFSRRNHYLATRNSEEEEEEAMTEIPNGSHRSTGKTAYGAL